MKVEGASGEVLVTLAQQLAWLGSALTLSPFGEELAYCRPSIKEDASSSTITVDYQFELLHDTESVCWLSLFSGASIASGFPISMRTNEIGVEIPLQILTAVMGVQNAVEYEGGLVMKGFSCMLVPTRITDDKIQWHVVSSHDPRERLTYNEGLSLCPQRLLLSEVNLQNISRYKAVVGWCAVATSRLGATSVNYGNINYSGTEDISTSLNWTGASFGFQNVGAGSLNFTLGPKDGKSHMQRSGPYRLIISAAEKLRIVLYDTGEKRAWLVPASEVILHMIQHRHYLEPFELNTNCNTLDMNTSAGSNAKQVLLQNEALSLFNDCDYTFKDAVLDVWSLLEFLIDQNVAKEKSKAGAPLKSPFKETLYGFEFKAVVQRRSPFRQKQTLLSKTNGGWPLLASDVDALVLLADGFEDIIVPTENENPGLCQVWSNVPKGHDYMAASTTIMKDIYDVAGRSHKYLTSTCLQWYQGSSILFDRCLESSTNHCRCNRLQRIDSKSIFGSATVPNFMENQGAVIFGKCKQSIKRGPMKPHAATASSRRIFSHKNVPIMSTDIQQDVDETSSSDSGRLDLDGSDGTIGSNQSSDTTDTSHPTEETVFGMGKPPTHSLPMVGI